MKNKTLSPAPGAMAMSAMSYESGSKKAFVSSNAGGGSGRALKGSAGNGSGNKRQGGISGKRSWGQGGRGGRGSDGRGSGFSIRGGGVVKRSMSRSALFCTRCGRETHIADNCYARCGVDGKKLDDCEDEEAINDDDDDDDEFSDEF